MGLEVHGRQIYAVRPFAKLSLHFVSNRGCRWFISMAINGFAVLRMRNQARDLIDLIIQAQMIASLEDSRGPPRGTF